MKCWHAFASIAVFAAIAGGLGEASADTITWKTTTNGSVWLTDGNWVGEAVPGEGDIAQFGQSTGTAYGINMANNGGNQNVGAIEITSARTTSIQIRNSNNNTSGTLTLHGATVNSTDHVVLRNASSEPMSLINSNGTALMPIRLNDATNNVVLIDGTGGISIANQLEDGAGNALTKAGSGTGTLTLSGANTYTGSTTVATGTLALGATGTINNSALIDVAQGATLDVTVATFNVGGAVAQTLQGKGTVLGTTNLNGMGTIVPGFSAGMLTTGSLTVSPDASFKFQLNPSDMTPGDNSNLNDLIVVTNALTLIPGIVNLDVQDSVSPGDFAGIGTWTLATFGSLTGLDPGVHNITASVNVTGLDLDEITSFFINANVGADGDGTITLTTVPEPGAFALGIMSMAIVGWTVGRNRK